MGVVGGGWVWVGGGCGWVGVGGVMLLFCLFVCLSFLGVLFSFMF